MILTCIIAYMLVCACLVLACCALSGRIAREEEVAPAASLASDRTPRRMGRR